MGRRVLAFFLGMLFGIIILLGSLGAALYIAATTVKPSDIYPDSDKFLGDLANMTLYDIYTEISNLYKEKLGIVGENGLYYTLGEFLDRYHIDQTTAFGKPLPEDLLEIPIFELFGGSTESARNQMKASVPFSFVNFITQTTDEDGNVVGGYFTQSAIDKLYKHSMAELMDQEKGAAYVFDEVVLADLLPSVFPGEVPEDGDKLMWAFGQSSVGKMLGGFEQNVMLQFKEGGAFATLGQLPVKDLIGSASIYITLIFGDRIFADLLDENGNLVIDNIMNNLYLGGLLGYNRQVIADLDGYVDWKLTEDGSTILRKITDSGDTTYAIVNDEVAYFAKATCGKDEHTHSENCFDKGSNTPSCGENEHEHDEICLEFIWYNCSDTSEDHEHNAECNEVGGAIGKLSSEKVKNLSNLSETVKKLTMRDVLGEDVPTYLKSIQDTPIGELSAAIDKMYLGEFLGYQRKEVSEHAEYDDDLVINDEGMVVVKSKGEDVIKLDDGKWYPVRLNCKDDEAHIDGVSHTEDCYDFIWFISQTEPTCGNDTTEHEHIEECYFKPVEGMMSKLASEKVKDLSNLGNNIKKFTLKDVLGKDVPGSLKAIENTPIRNLGNAIDKMYLRDFLQYTKKPALEGDYNREIADGVKENNDGDIIKRDEDGIWYTAKLDCTSTEENHRHTADCYDFLWYSLVCKHTDGHEDNCYKLAEGLVARLSILQIYQLTPDNIMDTVLDTPLGEVITLDEDSNGMLKELANVKVGELSNELDALYVGTAMGYTRQKMEKGSWSFVCKDDSTDKESKFEIYTDGNSYFYHDIKHDKYFTAIKYCNHSDSQQHEGGCFGIKWYICYENEFDSNHVHGTDCNDEKTLVKGLNAKMANLTIAELSGDSMSKIAQALTLGDLIDSGMMSLGDTDEQRKENMYKLAIICCKDEEHYFTESGLLGSDEKYTCTLQGFFTYKLSHPNDSVTAESYWLLTHKFTSEDQLQSNDITHRDSWKNQSLTEFISTLLGAL